MPSKDTIGLTSGARNYGQWKFRAALWLTLWVLALVTTATWGRAQTEKVLYSFQWNTLDGVIPEGRLAMDASGNLYGTTLGGGVWGNGTVFALIKSSGGYSEEVLYNFCNGIYCYNGSGPVAGVIMDASGDLYDTTSQGGDSPDSTGAVFEVSRASNQPSTYVEKVLHNFQGGPGDNLQGITDGAYPRAGLVMDGLGDLYGTTMDGGASPNCADSFYAGCGTVFELAYSSTASIAARADPGSPILPSNRLVLIILGALALSIAGACVLNRKSHTGNFTSGRTLVALVGVFMAGGILAACGGSSNSEAGGSYTYRVLYSFTGAPDGAYPQSRLVMDSAGNLYGTTSRGGTSTGCGIPVGCGTVFELVSSSGTYTEKVLYDFCSVAACADGASPSAGLIIDAAGNLYGTTQAGGAAPVSGCANGDCGTAFEMVNSGGNYTEKVLYKFCSQAGCADGSDPGAGLVMDASGNLYGTTTGGGTSQCAGPMSASCGTVFELNYSPGGYTERVLYSFKGQPDDGMYPGGLIRDPSGNLYGTTTDGGLTDSGVVWMVTP